YTEEKELMNDDSVSLREVAKGMIAFSSNANTEYLMGKLGIENIGERLATLGITDHTPLFYFTSALFIPYEIKKKEYPDQSMEEAKENIIQTMRTMEDKEWIKLSTFIHNALESEEDY